MPSSFSSASTLEVDFEAVAAECLALDAFELLPIPSHSCGETICFLMFGIAAELDVETKTDCSPTFS